VLTLAAVQEKQLRSEIYDEEEMYTYFRELFSVGDTNGDGFLTKEKCSS